MDEQQSSIGDVLGRARQLVVRLKSLLDQNSEEEGSCMVSEHKRRCTSELGS